MAPNISLRSAWNGDQLRGSLLSSREWHPYPRAGERGEWEGLPAAARRAAVELAEEALAAAWPPVPASVYLQFSQNGNRTNYEDLHFGRRKIVCDLMLGECVEGKGRFLAGLTDAIWSVCEESSWCLPAHTGAQKAGVGLPDTNEPVVDLFASETGALLAWAAYLLGEQLNTISPLILTRIRREVQTRILDPGMERDDFWWMGFVERPVNNWNPWCNSNWLACVLLLEDNPERRPAAVEKILSSLDIFLADYPADGGCDEGPNYWGRAGASLFDCLDLLYSASGGRLTVYQDPLIQNIGQYIYRAQIAGDFYLNFADASAVVKPDALLVRCFGERIGDKVLEGFGLWLAKRAGLTGDDVNAYKRARGSTPTRELAGLFSLAGIIDQAGEAPLPRDVWLPGLEVLAARDQAGSETGLYLAVKGGHNGESHNHNDVGHFVVYKDGRPLIIDAGVETYTRKTFSAQRYEIWTMQSAYHSLPTIGGVQQAPGKQFRAREVHREVSDGAAVFGLELSQAYPETAGLERWERTLTLRRGEEVRLADNYRLTRQPATMTLSLMTASVADAAEPGVVRLRENSLPDGRKSGQGEIRYDGERFELQIEEVEINDLRMQPVWGKRVFHLVFTERSPRQAGGWEFSFR